MLVNDAYLQRLIEIQRQTVRSYFLSAGVLATFGTGVMTCSFFFGAVLSAELNKTLTTIAGGFISSCSAWPFATVARRKEKMATLELLRCKLREAEDAKDSASLNEIAKVLDILLKPALEA